MSARSDDEGESTKTATWVNDTGWELPTPATERQHRAKYPGDWARYDFAAAYARGKRVLDCGTGAGFGAWLLGKAGAEQVVGVDNSPEAIAWCNQHFTLPNVEFRLADARGLPVEMGTMDLAVSFETIEHIPVDGVNQFVEALARALKSGGTLILSTPLTFGDERFRPANRFHAREYNDEELPRLLAPHFDVVEQLGQHSPGSSRFGALKRALGLGALVRAGLHRLVPESALSPIRALLARPRTGQPASWISRENWRDAPVQVLVAKKR